MASNNPLRPYYDHDSFNAGYSVIFKPGVGLIDTTTNKPITASLASSVASQTSNQLFASGRGIGISSFSKSTQITDYSSNVSDKNYVYDLEFQEYFDVNNLSELLKNLVWNFCKNYFKVVLSQPLEAVRLVLQVGYFDFSKSAKQPKKEKTAPAKKYSRLLDTSSASTPFQTDISESDSEGEIDYFQSSSQPALKSLTLDARKAQASILKGKQIKKVSNPNKIDPVSKHTIDIMTAIATKDGPFALFRGINASFIHQTLSHTIEAWITGFISPFLSIPDPFFLDLTHLTEPLKSLWLSVLACVLTGLILMPLDLIKVRLMITQFNRPQVADETWSSASSPENAVPQPEIKLVNTRSVRESVRNYPLKFLLHPPPTIALLTALHQFSTTVFRKTAPYLMFVRFNVDSYSSPNLYTLFNLLLLITEFFIKLPVENLLRKEQVRFLLSPKTVQEDPMRIVTIENPDEDLIVTFNAWDSEDMVNEEDYEGDEAPKKPAAGYFHKIAKMGLFDGWRVGVLNVIGFWGYNILKSDSTALKAEKL